MFEESDLLPISALQHLLFCERQCALIHIERLWAENRFTAEGNHLHRKAHDGKPETRDGVRITRGLPLRSLELGLVGQADVINWKPPPGENLGNIPLSQVFRAASVEQRRKWTITLVEYKRGSPKKNDCDRVQLCAQALCLEEMLGVDITTGDLFYGKRRRRLTVAIDDALRNTTVLAAERLHKLIDSRITPPPIKEKKCETCSLLPLCLPGSQKYSARLFLERSISDHLASHGPKTDCDEEKTP